MCRRGFFTTNAGNIGIILPNLLGAKRYYAPEKMTIGDWYHLALVRQGNYVSLYVNGINVTIKDNATDTGSTQISANFNHGSTDAAIKTAIANSLNATAAAAVLASTEATNAAAAAASAAATAAAEAATAAAGLLNPADAAAAFAAAADAAAAFAAAAAAADAASAEAEVALAAANAASAEAASANASAGTSFFYVNSSFGGEREFNGVVSNVRVVKGTAVYTANFTVPTAPLGIVSDTKILLNPSSDNLIKDSSSYNNILRSTGPVAYSSDSPFTG